MITDLANLGPSLRTSDLGAGKAKDKLDLLRKPESGAKSEDSFDQTLQSKMAGDKKANRSDKLVDKKQENQPRMATEKKSAESPAEPKEGREESTESVRGKEKSKSTKETAKKNKAESAQGTREQVMLQFMDSMESEFGIPPERIVEAMTNLSESESLSSPEDSASQVIDQLQLPPDQAQKAYQMYSQLLGELGQMPKQSEFQPQMLAPAMVPATALTMKERREMLNDSLDRMNSDFFMRPEISSQGQRLGSMTEMTTVSSDITPMDRMNWNEGTDALTYKAPMGQGPRAEIPTNDTLMPMDPNALQGMSADSSESMAKLAEKLAALGATAGAVDQAIKNDPQNLQALKAEQWLKNQGFETPTAGAAAVGSALGAAAVAGFEGQENDASLDLGHHSSESLGQLSHLTHRSADSAQGFSQALAGAGAGAATAQGANAQDGDGANINQIMQQAQYMIKKGGGESRIKMSPEGMGQLHMKVVVQDGKVSVEMATDNKDAKKLIENSLGDLKHSLGLQRLSVDSIKVDVGNQLASDKHNNPDQNQQRQMGSHGDMGRDQARQFFNQFRDENSGRRNDAFWDSPGLRAYSRGRNVDPLQPADTVKTANKRYAGEKKGSGLDLVA